MDELEPKEEDRQRAAALVNRFPRDGAPTPSDAWRALQQAITPGVRDGAQGFLFALHEAAGEHPLLLSWPRQSAWRAAGLVAEAGALRRFLSRARRPPSSELPFGQRPQLPDGPGRTLGAMLAHAHDDELLDRELEHFGLDPLLVDLFACWIHERVLRGSTIGR